MEVRVEQGRIVGLEPHTGNRATSQGLCLKGLSYVERVTSPDRITTPLLRKVGGGGVFEPVSWDAALDRITSEIRACHEEGGPRSVLYYQGSGTKGLLNGVGSAFWRLTGGYTTTYGDLCWPSGLEATRLTLGANLHNAPWDLEKARLIVLWGKNPAETNVHQIPFIERAMEGGATLVVIDPRRTESADRADLHIRPRPGTDGAIALAAAGLLIEHDLVDGDFIASHVKGFGAFRERALQWPVDRAAAVAGIPGAQIEELARLFGSIKPATVCAGFGMQRFTNSGQAMRALIALPVITGNIGVSGGGWQFANLYTQIFGGPPDPIACYPPEKPDGVVRVSIATARLGREMLDTSDPPLRMAWVERGNPIAQNPETNTTLKAFRKLRFRVVIDQFMTDTAREADIVLPAKSLFEQSDVIGAYWHPYIQLKAKVIEPPGQVKPESEIYRLLGERLGLDRESLSDAIPGASDEEVDAWLERRLAPFPELTLDRLRAGPVLAPGTKEIAFADHDYATPSGRIELESEEAVRWWGVDPLPEHVEPIESIVGERSESERDKSLLHMLTPCTKNSIHSQFINLEMIRHVGGEPAASLGPEDAAARGIADGDRVRLSNDRGAFSVSCRIDRGIREGCVAVTNGWWLTDGAAANVCSCGRETDMGHGAAFHDNLVRVEKSE